MSTVSTPSNNSSTGRLPQLDHDLFLTDGGIETTLIFDDGLDLPDFAAFVLLRTDEGRAALTRYVATYADLARRTGVGIVIETPTWRASSDWAARLGYSVNDLVEANRQAVELVRTASAPAASDADVPIVVSGSVGPRGDGYDPGQMMTPDAARSYHALQVRALAAAGADMIGAITMTNTPEAIGLTLAAHETGLPVAISFTVETDGALPTGQPLGDAIVEVDQATSNGPAYYMINCAHPTHFQSVLDTDEAWVRRIRGMRVNASELSHAELDEATELDRGNIQELGAQVAELRNRHPYLSILGGCCGTDHDHIAAIASACTRP